MIQSKRGMGFALLAAVAAVAGVLAATAVAGVQRQHADFTLKMGYVTSPLHPYGLAMTQYKRRVEAASGGRVDIVLTPRYAGGDDIQLLNDLGGGTQDGGAVSIAVLPNGNINNLIPLQLPFLVDSYELERRLITNSSGIAQQMLRGIERNSKLVPVGLFEGGMRQFVLKDKYVTTLASLKGLKVRVVQAPHMSDTFKALGTSPTPMAVGDVPLALKNGQVDGTEANSGLISTFGWHTAGANRVSVANIFPFPAVVMFNKDKFNTLPADIQKVLRTEANDLAAYSISVVQDTTTFPSRLCGAGVRYAGVPDSARKQMVTATKGVIAKYTTKKYRNLAPIVAAIQRQKARIKGTPTDAPPSSCIDGNATKFLAKP